MVVDTSRSQGAMTVARYIIAIPKSNSVARTEENCGASGWRLSPEQVQRLDQAFPV